MENYVHHGWCKEIFKSDHFREIAIDSLCRMGLQRNDWSRITSTELCELLSERTCTVSRQDISECTTDWEGNTISPYRKISIRCGGSRGKVQCWDILKLDHKIKNDKTFAATLSKYQTNKIHRAVKLYRKNIPLPCYVLSSNKEGCDKQTNRCGYHERSLLSSLFSPSVRMYPDKTCYLTKEYLIELTFEHDLDTLRTVVLDIHYDQIARQLNLPIYRDISLYEQYMLSSDADKLLYELYDQIIEETDKTQLLLVIGEYSDMINNIPQYDMSWERIIRMLETMVMVFLSGIEDRYITWHGVKRIGRILGIDTNDTVIQSTTYILNLILYYVESNISWGMWLLLFPAGRQYIRKIQRDPQLAVFLFVSLNITGIKDPHLPNVDGIGSNIIDWKRLVPVTDDIMNRLDIGDKIQTAVFNVPIYKEQLVNKWSLLASRVMSLRM